MSDQTKRLTARVCQVMTWLMALAVPVLGAKWMLEGMEVYGSAAVLISDMIKRDETVLALLMHSWFYVAAVVSIPFILAYIAFAVFGYRISFRREAKQLWRI